MSKTAHILAVDANNVIFLPTGFHPMGEEEVLDHLTSAGLFIGPRPMLEEDERFRQIIPYIVIKQGPDFLGYVRGTDGGEARLHGKIAIGAGGHIDLADVRLEPDGSVGLSVTLDLAGSRELEEELVFSYGGLARLPPKIRWAGLLVDNTDAVGRVHIGVVGVAETECEITAKEDCISQLDSFSAEDLAAAEDRLESWSKLLLPHLDKLA